MTEADRAIVQLQSRIKSLDVQISSMAGGLNDAVTRSLLDQLTQEKRRLEAEVSEIDLAARRAAGREERRVMDAERAAIEKEL